MKTKEPKQTKIGYIGISFIILGLVCIAKYIFENEKYLIKVTKVLEQHLNMLEELLEEK